MSFVEERLLDCVSYGTQSGPSWLTRRVPLRSGIVRRNPLRARPTYRFVIVFRNLLEEHHREVVNAFNACFGGAFGFRCKDWSDYVATDELVAIATGAPQSVQLAKVYAFGTLDVSRPIRKPVTGTVSLTANSVPIASSVDYTTGIVTFTATAGHVVRWSGEFDVPVYFEDDDLLSSLEDRGAEGFFLTADVTLLEDKAA